MLKEIAQKHDYWIKVAKSFGVGDYAPDIVQEMYIKLNKYIEAGTLKEETVTTYVYCIIRSLCLDLKRLQKKRTKVDLTDCVLTDKQTNNEVTALNVIYDKIDEEINSWRWYDAKLFNIYVNNKYSQRYLSKETGIKLGSIHYTIKKAGNKLKKVIEEDYQDLLNKDYELIK